MRFSPWIMLFATSLSRKNHLFPKRKKRGTGYDISSAAIFFLAIKWPWLLKLFANNMLNIVIKRKREFLDFFRFFSKNSNFWRKFKYVIWSIVYPWKANGLTVKMSMISQLIYQVWGALWMFSSIAAKFNPELAVCHMSIIISLATSGCLSESAKDSVDSPRVWEAMSPWFRESKSTQDYPRVKATQAK